MQCHFCELPADVVVETDGVRVGVCEAHFREQLDELADTDWLTQVEADFDRESIE